MTSNTVIDLLLRDRHFQHLPTEDPLWHFYTYDSGRLSYFLLINLSEGKINIGVDFLGGVPFGATSLFEVCIEFDEIAYFFHEGYGRPSVKGECHLSDGTNGTVIELMVRDDGDLIIWPQGFLKKGTVVAN